MEASKVDNLPADLILLRLRKQSNPVAERAQLQRLGDRATASI
jgi:hypothetical protein